MAEMFGLTFIYTLQTNHRKKGNQMIQNTNIIREWLALRGSSKADAVKWLNAELGRKYQQSRMLEWEKRIQPIPQIVLRAILPEILPTVLRKNGVTPTPQIIEAVEWAAGFLPDDAKT